MVNCCVPYCKMRSETSDLSFFYFPNDEKQKMEWLQRIRRVNKDGSPWEPTLNSRVCSWHFPDGRDVGAGPTRFHYPASLKKRTAVKRTASRCGIPSIGSDKIDKSEDINNKCIILGNIVDVSSKAEMKATKIHLKTSSDDNDDDEQIDINDILVNTQNAVSFFNQQFLD